MKREIYSQLLEWKENPSRKPLMLYGARQVGKTYIVKEFGNREFDNLVYINCYNNREVKEIFEKDTDISRILLALSVLTGEQIKPFSTLLFFDEAQEIPEVIAALKYFCEDARDYCVVVAGSLLGVLNLENISFPTGKVNMMRMYPMTFVEFLEAMGQNIKVKAMEEGEFDTVNLISDKYVELLRQYYYVGGMPEAVKNFIYNRDPQEVRRIQNEIINSYYSDIAKHAGAQTQRCRLVFESIPAQLGKENKKFIFGAVRPGGRAAEFEVAIQWLVDAGLVYKVKRVSKVEQPLSFYMENNVFKLYLLDVGLMGAMADTSPKSVFLGQSFFSEYKGAFTENYVESQLVTLQPEPRIAYYSKDNSKVEVDFILQYQGHLLPIEVKAEENVKSKSLRQFITVDNADTELHGYRFSMKGFVRQEWMTNVPLYAIIPFLKGVE